MKENIQVSRVTRNTILRVLQDLQEHRLYYEKLIKTVLKGKKYLQSEVYLVTQVVTGVHRYAVEVSHS